MDVLLVIVWVTAATAAMALVLVARMVLSPVPGQTVDAPRSVSWLWIAALPAIRLLEPLAARTLSARGQRRMHEQISRAGWSRTLSATQVRSIQCWALSLCATALCLGSIYLSGRIHPGLVLLAALVGFAWPLQIMRRQSRVRQQRMRRQLPFLIDLVAMSVDAGLPLSAALSQAVDRAPGGPLREEFLRALGEIKAGRTREEALTALSDRVAQPALTQFVLALLAIQRDGGSVLHLLKTIAEQQRSDRLIRAEHQAMQAPVKLLFPLVVFIFPGTFAILLYPVIARAIAQGGLW